MYATVYVAACALDQSCFLSNRSLAGLLYVWHFVKHEWLSLQLLLCGVLSSILVNYSSVD